MKLIKINTDHYVVVDNSQIKEGDYVSTNGGGIRYVTKLNNYKKDNIFLDDGLLSNQEPSPHCHIHNYKKITHSTQPLEKFTYDNLSDEVFSMDYHNIKPIALQEVKESFCWLDGTDWDVEFVNGKLKLK